MRCTSFLRADIAGAIAVDVSAGPNSTVDAAQRLAPPLSEALSIALALHAQQNNISKGFLQVFSSTAATGLGAHVTQSGIYYCIVIMYFTQFFVYREQRESLVPLPKLDCLWQGGRKGLRSPTVCSRVKPILQATVTKITYLFLQQRKP